MMTNKWRFAVAGCDWNELPQYLGFTNSYRGAVELQRDMTAVGWRRVTVIDARLREVKTRAETSIEFFLEDRARRVALN